MIGLCSGKVRSTPTPKLTLRTVNASRMPSPASGDDHAGEDLDSGAGALDDLDVHFDGVAWAEGGKIAAQRCLVELVDELAHENFLAGATGHHGRTSS